MKISKKHLLEWTTSEEAEKQADGSIFSYVKQCFVNIIVGILVIYAGIKIDNLALKIGFYILGILWISIPFIMQNISMEKNIEDAKNKLDKKEQEYLLKIGKKTWDYFNTYMNEENNFLPPDNYQEDRKVNIVDRTSSTNIGLSLLCIVSSFDLNLISKEDAIEKLEKVLSTIEILPKWNGHLYNWYNIRTLKPLNPRYISTVDSGNFVGYLYTLKQFLLSINTNEKIANMIKLVDKLITNTNFAVLYDEKKRLFSIGYDVEENKLTNSYYDLLASEARQASYVAIAKKDISPKHWNNLSRTLTVLDEYKGLISWSGTAFEYLMPNINMTHYEGSLLDESSKFLIMSQEKYAKKLGIPWGISESAFYLKDLNGNYQYKAFGIPWLGLKRGLADELVVASYASILAICEKPKEVVNNLKELERQGMYGKYGFYESIDYTPYRILENEKGMPVKTYMAHHQALILLSINNLFNKKILEKRFMDNPEMKAIDILLQERMPEDMIITKEKKEKIEKIKYVGYQSYTKRVYSKLNPNLNYTNVIGNGNYTVALDEKGNGFSMYKDILVNRYKNTADYSQGILFFFKNIRSKKIWSAGIDSNIAKPDKFTIAFSPDNAEYVRQDEMIETKMKVVVEPEENVEIRQIILKNNGSQDEIVEVSSLMEPVLSKKEQDYAHMAFNNLFLKYEKLENSNSILVKRNKRGDTQDLYLATNLYTNEENTIGELEYEIDKEKLYEAGKIKVPKMIEDSKPFSKFLGLAVNSCIAMRKTVKVEAGKSVCLNLIITVSEDKDEVEKNIKKYENAEIVERVFELSKAKIEEEVRYLGITGKDIEVFQKLLSYIVFPTDIKKIYNMQNVSKTFRQSDLWKFGISGDLPIILMEIKELNDSYILEECLKAYEYFRAKNIFIDLVILMKEENIYEQYIKQNVYRLIENHNLSYLENVSGGIYLLNENEIEEKDLLKMRANIIIDAKGGTLKAILDDIESEYLESIKEIMDENIQKNPIPEFEVSHPNIDMEKLKYYNGYGGFSENGKEYIIKINKENKTPTVWSHIISNQKFGCMVTSNQGGFTWSKNSRLNRLTAWNNDSVIDMPSEIIYLKDKQIDKTWSMGLNPMSDENDYYITYGFGYANVYHSSFGIVQTQEIFVPKNDSIKINKVTLRNTMPSKRNLKLVYYIKPVLGEDENISCYYLDTNFNSKLNLVTVKNLYENDISKIMYISSNQTIKSFTGRKKAFVGNRDISNPAGINKISLGNENSFGSEAGIAIEIELNLESFETKEITLMIGEAENQNEAQTMVYKYSKIQNVNNEQIEVKKYWEEILGKVQVKTPVESTNILLNGWVAYQTIACRLWAKSAFYQSGGAIGFRDQLQDTLGIKYLSDNLMKDQIIEHSRHQFIEGDVEHWWHNETKRGIRTRFSDDLLWLVYVTVEYIKYVNSEDILDVETSFLQGEILKNGEDEKYDFYPESDKKANIYTHIIKAIDKSLDFGENGLPKIGSGDWNDGMNTVGNKGKGESVWLGFFLYAILDKIIPICKKRNDDERAIKYEEIKNNLRKALNNNAWDGRWYKRAFTDDGKVLGCIENEECKIDSIAQSWSVISKAGDNDKKYIAMESLENHLIDKENGIIKLLDPPFENGDLEPGYIKAYLPGVRENGGQYTHAAIWAVIAMSMLGFGEKAFEYFRMINPIEHARTKEASKKYKVEPYVIAADIYSTSNLQGRGGWTWYTGSSSWMYKAGIEYILGLKIENGYLKISPSIPSTWKEYEIKYRYKNTLYHIKVKNPNLKTGPQVKTTINGELKIQNEIKLEDDRQLHEIEIELI